MQALRQPLDALLQNSFGIKRYQSETLKPCFQGYYMDIPMALGLSSVSEVIAVVERSGHLPDLSPLLL